MPYIEDNFRKGILERHEESPDNKGELNFVLTKQMLLYVRDHGLSYSTLNDISGAMTESLAEFRRRVIGPYEDQKRKCNGDVYPKEFK